MRAGHTELTKRREPTPQEGGRGAQVVFERKAAKGETVTVLAAKCHESWQQWGAPEPVLWDNIADVEAWRARFK